jgi:hypothetical protein
MKYFFLLPFLAMASFAQVERKSLQEYAVQVNKDLPEVYDSITKLMSATVVNNNLEYRFIVNADQKEFDGALPKVKNQVLKTVCSAKRDRTVLVSYKAGLVYRYENLKGLTLGEFFIRPEHCKK